MFLWLRSRAVHSVFLWLWSGTVCGTGRPGLDRLGRIRPLWSGAEFRNGVSLFGFGLFLRFRCLPGVSGVAGFSFDSEGLDPETVFGFGSVLGFSMGVAGTWCFLGSEVSVEAGTGVRSDGRLGWLNPELP